MALANAPWQRLNGAQTLWKHFIDISRIASILPDAIQALKDEPIPGSYDDNRICHKEFLNAYMRAIDLRLDRLKSVLWFDKQFQLDLELLRQVEEYDNSVVVSAGTGEGGDIDDLGYNNPNRISSEDFARALYFITLDTFGAENDVIEEGEMIFTLLYPDMTVLHPDVDGMYDPFESFMREKDKIAKKIHQKNLQADIYEEDDQPDHAWLSSDYPDALKAFLDMKSDRGEQITSFSHLRERKYPGLPLRDIEARPRELVNRYQSQSIQHSQIVHDSDSESGEDSDATNPYSGYAKKKRYRGERKMPNGSSSHKSPTKSAVSKRIVPRRKGIARK